MPGRTCDAIQDEFDGEFPFRHACPRARRIDSIKHRKISAQEPADKEMNSDVTTRWRVQDPEVDQAGLVDLITDRVVVLRPPEAAHDLPEAICGRPYKVQVDAEIHAEPISDWKIVGMPG